MWIRKIGFYNYIFILYGYKYKSSDNRIIVVSIKTSTINFLRLHNTHRYIALKVAVKIRKIGCTDWFAPYSKSIVCRIGGKVTAAFDTSNPKKLQDKNILIPIESSIPYKLRLGSSVTSRRNNIRWLFASVSDSWRYIYVYASSCIKNCIFSIRQYYYLNFHVERAVLKWLWLNQCL